MADNILVSPGTGATIAADDIGGVLHQRVKLSQGADGVGVDVSSAAPLQVTLANTGTNATAVKVDGSAVTQPVSGTVAISGTPTVSGTVAVSTINSVAPAFGTGVRGATVQRVTIATDDSVPVTGTFYQATQPVSIATAPVLVAGSAVIGKVGIDQTTPGTTNKVDIGTNGTVAVSGTVTVGSHAVTNAGTFAVQAASAGDVANDGVDSGNPIKVGGVATVTEQTAISASGDRVNASFTSTGKQIVAPFSTPEYFVSGAITTAMTATTSTSLVAAPGSGLRNYITTIIVSNAHATVGTDVIIQDGSGGTTLLTIPAAAVYGGAVINLPIPLRQPTTNTAIYCANVTTGASTKVSAVGYKGI